MFCNSYKILVNVKYQNNVLLFQAMLSDTCVKQQNKIGKIFKNSKFHFFKIEPKLGKTNL